MGTLGGGGLSGGGDINTLGGVSITSPTNGQFLVYNSVDGLWENSNGGGSSGYTTIQGQGTAVAQETALNFVSAAFSVSDDPTHMRTNVSLTLPSSYQTIENQGVAVAQESILNFATTGIVAADNVGAGRTDVSLASTLVDVGGLTATSGYAIVGNGAHFVTGTAANIADNYAPVNYTATSSYIDGQLAGIDTKLGTIPTSAITALTGDVVATGPGSVAATIQPNVVSNAKLAQAPTETIKGNNTGSTANVADLTVTQVTAMLNTFVGDSGSGGTKGLVPAPSANSYGSGDFLNAGGTFSYVDQSKNISPNFSLVTQGPVPSGAPGTIKYESTTIFTSIVTGKNYAIGVGFIGSPTLTIWDISDQRNPVITGTFVAAGGGAYNCTIGVVAGVQYAFIGYNSGSHFVVVNLTNVAVPVQTSSTVITGTAGSIYDVCFLNGYVYCGTQSAGLVVMDVGGGTGSPAVPVQTYTQGSPYKSFGVVAIGTNVFTTQYSTSSPYTTRQIISWTLTGLGSPSVPSLVQSLQVTAAGEALGLSISGNTAFVTTAATGAYNINLVDITTPSAMTNLSQINSTNSFDSAFYAVASGNYLYIPSGANATYGGAIDAYDITNRSAPVHIAQVTTGNPNDVFGTLALSGGYIFCANYGVAASNNGSFDVFTQINANAIIGEMLSSTAYIQSLTPSTALVASASNEVISSVTTATELSYVHGVTSSIQAQLNALAPFTVQVITTNTTLVPNTGYIVNGVGQLTLTLPSTFAEGSIIKIAGYAGGWTIIQNSGQNVLFGNQGTTITTGSLTSTSDQDCLEIWGLASNQSFLVVNSSGQITIT